MPTPLSEVDDPANVRSALLDQLRYLIDELEAQKKIVDLVPEPIREGRPQPGALSIKEIYGVIARRNEAVFPVQLERMVQASGEAPSFEAIDDQTLAQDEDWNAQSIHDILGRVQSAREEMIAAFKALRPDDWAATGQFDDGERDVYEFAYHIIQDDTRRLQTIGHRLHESNLTGRTEDLPK